MWLPIQPRNFASHVTLHPPARPSARPSAPQGNQPDIAHTCCGELTAVCIGIHWSVSHDRIVGSVVDLSWLRVFLIFPLISYFSRLPVTRTLYNSNLPLTRSFFHFPSDHFPNNFTLNNSNFFLFPELSGVDCSSQLIASSFPCNGQPCPQGAFPWPWIWGGKKRWHRPASPSFW